MCQQLQNIQIYLHAYNYKAYMHTYVYKMDTTGEYGHLGLVLKFKLYKIQI